MKYCAILLIAAAMSCSSPGPLTANPDDATSSPGTVGSSKMTDQMPRSPSALPDTAYEKRDSIPRVPR